MYFLTVSIEALPIEQQKYPSLQKVFSFQKYLFNSECNFHIFTVVSCLSLLTICNGDIFVYYQPLNEYDPYLLPFQKCRNQIV